MSEYDLLRRLQTAEPQPAPPASEQSVRRQLAWAAGTEQFYDRDPLWHLNESFCQTFDLAGSIRAQAGGAQPADQSLLQTFLEGISGGERTRPGSEPAHGAENAPAQNDISPEPVRGASMEDRYQQSREGPPLLNRFSELTFNRGRLGAAVLQGTGDMMLVSCLKRTVQQSQPKNWQQRSLFQGASKTQNIRTPGGARRAVYNRGFTDSAVGLVVSALADVNAVVEDMQGILAGDQGLFPGSADTLQRMYPFLDDHQERTLLEQYRSRLAQLGGGPENAGERTLLLNAQTRARAQLDRKAVLTRRFTDQLRMLKDSAATAIAVFSTPAFRDILTAELNAKTQDLPPPEGGGDRTPPEDGTPPEPPPREADTGTAPQTRQA